MRAFDLWQVNVVLYIAVVLFGFKSDLLCNVLSAQFAQLI